MTVEYFETYSVNNNQSDSDSSHSLIDLSEDVEDDSSSSSVSDAINESTVDKGGSKIPPCALPSHTSHPETMYLYECEKVRELFKGLKLTEFNALPSSKSEDCKALPSVTLPVSKSRLTVSSTMACSVCSVTFNSREEQLSHFRSQQHRDTVSRESRATASASTGSVSASPEISFSAEDDRKQNKSRHSRLFLTNASRQLFSVYKCLLFSKRSEIGQSQVESAVKQLPHQLNTAVFLISGGRFAAAVFNGGTMLVHKTFHTYTVRAGQGTCQGTRDRRDGHRCKSAGASLRRYNLATFTQHVRQLLSTWQSHLSSCQLIFVRAVRGSAGAAALFGRPGSEHGAPGLGTGLSRKDGRLRSIPFPTRRPSHAELVHVYAQLMTLHVYGTDVDIDLSQLPESPSKRRQRRSKPLPSAPHSRANTSQSTPVPTHPGTNTNRSVLVSTHPGTNTTSPLATSSVDESCNTTLSINNNNNDDGTTTEGEPVEDEGIEIKYMSRVLDLTDHGLDGLSSNARDWEDANPPMSPPPTNRRTRKSIKRATRSNQQNDVTRGKELFLSPETTSEIQPENSQNETDATVVKKDRVGEELDRVGESSSDGKLSGRSEVVKELPPELKESLVICYTLCREGNAELLLAKLKTLSAPLTNQNSPSSDVTTIPSSDWLEDTALLANLRSDWRIVRLTRERLGASERTLLHTASVGGHGPVVRLLLEIGSDPTCRDKQGQTACDLSADRGVRNVFRKYRAAHPSQHDYAKAHVPAPLTDSMEHCRSARVSVRRQQQKERRRQLMKQKRAQETEERRIAQEARIQEEERIRFLALPDREKMALAAERRISQQLAAETGRRVVLTRCFCCGIDITGKVPFTYSQFIFCSTVCVRHHRAGEQKQC